jgi:hypothetical protein
MNAMTKAKIYLVGIWLATMIYMLLTERPEWS